MPRSQKVTFKTLSVKGLIHQIDGPEPPYPVYYLGKQIKIERPEVPGGEYRWLRDQPDE